MRPEEQAPRQAARFYDAATSQAYSHHTHVAAVQEQLSLRTLRVLEGLLAAVRGRPLSRPLLLLELGCGSGLSTAVFQRAGHAVVAGDVSPDMLALGVKDGRLPDAVRFDFARDLPLRPGAAFDGAVSVSALQWLCSPQEGGTGGATAALEALFTAVFARLHRPAALVAQVYPKDAAQSRQLVDAARRVGLQGVMVADFPHRTTALKWFLCVFDAPPTPLAVSLCALARFEAPCCVALHAALAAQGGPEQQREGGEGQEGANGPQHHHDNGQPEDEQDAQHLAWVRRAHAKHAHRLLRTARWLARNGAPETPNGGLGGAQRRSRRPASLRPFEEGIVDRLLAGLPPANAQQQQGQQGTTIEDVESVRGWFDLLHKQAD